MRSALLDLARVGAWPSFAARSPSRRRAATAASIGGQAPGLGSREIVIPLTKESSPMTVARRSLLAGGTAGVGLVVAGAVPSLAEAAPAQRRSPQPSLRPAHRPFPPFM